MRNGLVERDAVITALCKEYNYRHSQGETGGLKLAWIEKAVDSVPEKIEGRCGMKPIVEILEEVKADMCKNYCKWPDQWDEEKEGMDLIDSDQCMNCPLNKL